MAMVCRNDNTGIAPPFPRFTGTDKFMQTFVGINAGIQEKGFFVEPFDHGLHGNIEGFMAAEREDEGGKRLR